MGLEAHGYDEGVGSGANIVDPHPVYGAQAVQAIVHAADDRLAIANAYLSGRGSELESRPQHRGQEGSW